MAYSARIQAWVYPGEPACNADEEYSDGRNMYMLKPEYYTVNSSGVLAQLTTGCNAYSPSNALDIKRYSSHQFFTISSNRANMATLVADSQKRTNAVNTIVSFLDTIGFDGVELDWEGYGAWTSTEYANYKNFVSQLATELHNNGYKLMIDGPPIGDGTEQGFYEWQYEDFSAIDIDFIVALAYDWQYDFGGGTSISPNARVQNVCDWMKARIDIDKIIIGMPIYGYHATTEGFSITIDTKAQSEQLTGYDTATRNSDHEMNWANGGVSYFFQDSTGIDSKRDIIEAKGIKNISVWHLGGNDWFPDVEPPPRNLVTRSQASGRQQSSSRSLAARRLV